jgi:hypothetical protein
MFSAGLPFNGVFRVLYAMIEQSMHAFNENMEPLGREYEELIDELQSVQSLVVDRDDPQWARDIMDGFTKSQFELMLSVARKGETFFQHRAYLDLKGAARERQTQVETVDALERVLESFTDYSEYAPTYDL